MRGSRRFRTAVGGLACTAPEYVRLTPRRDPEAMAGQFIWIAAHRAEAAAQAARGREFVQSEWSRQKAFSSLSAVLAAVARNDKPETQNEKARKFR